MPRYTYSDETIRDAVASSKSWANVVRIVTGNEKIRTGHQTHFKKRAVAAGIDFSHFTGQGWNKGGTSVVKRPIEYWLKNDGPFVKSNDLKIKLIKRGIKMHSCESCGLSEWMGKLIPIELDHIDGNHSNNELSNLRILCPNCHAQTETYCGKNI